MSHVISSLELLQSNNSFIFKTLFHRFFFVLFFWKRAKKQQFMREQREWRSRIGSICVYVWFLVIRAQWINDQRRRQITKYKKEIKNRYAVRRFTSAKCLVRLWPRSYFYIRRTIFFFSFYRLFTSTQAITSHWWLSPYFLLIFILSADFSLRFFFSKMNSDTRQIYCPSMKCLF